MGVGDVDVRIVENPTATTVDTAITAMLVATNTTARFTVTALGMGKGVLIVGVAQA